MHEIYLDNAATTKIHPAVLEAMHSYMQDEYYNPSGNYKKAKKINKDIEEARAEIAQKINVDPSEIIFTSGATEANNLAIYGVAKANPSKKHIITSIVEHPAILECCKDFEKQGYRVDYIPVDREGIVDISTLQKKMTQETLLVSIMHANNEIGTIQPIEEIAQMCEQLGVYFHTDATQTFAKIPLDASRYTMLSASAHKIQGPKGVGFLYIKLGTKIKPMIHGGGQEYTLRSGTQNVVGIIGMKEASKQEYDKSKMQEQQEYIIKELLSIPGSKLNGSQNRRLYTNINISFYGIESQALVARLEDDNILVSAGSACASTKVARSHVLEALGVDDKRINGSIRISCIETLPIDELEYIIERITMHAEELMKISPHQYNN